MLYATCRGQLPVACGHMERRLAVALSCRLEEPVSRLALVTPHTLAHTVVFCQVELRLRIAPSIPSHTSPDVTIRQHTSAYVSIGQHTSAFGRIRQDS